jgi:aminopeptidase N
MKSLLLAGLGLGASLVFADTYPRQFGVDVQHYIFRVTLGDDNDEIAGETTVDLLVVKDGVTEVAFDLTSVKGGKGMKVSAVTEGVAGDGYALKYTHTANRLAITLPAAAKSGELRQFTVTYGGAPAAGLKFVKNKYGERGMFSANWPDLARQWLPCIDHPYDKATSEFIITAPAKYQVVANGLLQETIDLGDGRRVTHWKQSVPIATWLNSIGVAQFASRHFGTAAGVPLQTWVFHQDRDKGMVTFEGPTRQSIEFFSDHIGPYPYEKLAQVQNGSSSGGGMEHASAIFYGQDSVNGVPAFSLVAHETAHQWFGDSVTEKDWDDVWLSEGFATYFALLCTEHYQGRDAFVAGLGRSRAGVFNAEKRSPGIAIHHDNLADMSKVLNQIVYQKGGWTLHMLRGLIGADKFWAGVREYYRRYRDSNASSDDFRKAMEQTSGSDLGWFFVQWLYRPGSPVVEGGWRYNAESKKIEIELAQTQASGAYRLPMEVGITAAGAPPTKFEKIEMTQKQQKFEIAAGQEPTAVELDPNTWVLMDAKFAKR